MSEPTHAYMTRCRTCNGVTGVASTDWQIAKGFLKDASKHGDLISTVPVEEVRDLSRQSWCSCPENQPEATAPAQPDLFGDCAS